MKRIALLVILLFCFLMLSFADNARLDARRDAHRYVNDMVWVLAGFSVPLLIAGYYSAGGTYSYTAYVPCLVAGSVSYYYPISPRTDRLLDKSEVKSFRRRSLLWGVGVGTMLFIVLR